MLKISKEIVQEILSNPERSRMFDLVEKYLLTESQGRFMQGNGLTLAAIFDGQILPDDLDVVDAIFADWNKLCGQKIFKLK